MRTNIAFMSSLSDPVRCGWNFANIEEMYNWRLTHRTDHWDWKQPAKA